MRVRISEIISFASTERINEAESQVDSSRIAERECRRIYNEMNRYEGNSSAHKYEQWYDNKCTFQSWYVEERLAE